MATDGLTETLRETLAVFGSSGAPGEPLTTSEVAEGFDVSRRSVYARLERLVEHDLLETKKVGAKGRIWWRPADAEDAVASSAGDGSAGDGASNPNERRFGGGAGEAAGEGLAGGMGPLAGVLRNQRDLVYAVDADEQFVEWSDRVTAVTGYEDREIARMHPTDFVADEAVERVGRAMERVLEDGESVTVEAPIETVTGDRIPYEFTGTPIRDDGEVVGLTGVGRDVTERKRKERRLESQRDELVREFNEVLERIDDAFYAVDEKYRFTYVNERAEQLLGRSREELFGRRVWEVLPHATGADVWESVREALERREPTSYEAYFEPVDGWIEANVYPSETGLSVYFRDVTERKERERELERYERIVQNLPVGVYRNTPGPDGEFVEMNDRLAEIYDADSTEELTGHTVSDLYADPERRREFSERLEAEGIVTDAELRQETLEGRAIWISTTAIETEEDGETYFDGIVQDVTERKQRERELEQYETVARTARDAIVTIDTDSVVRDVNPAIEDVFGYDPEAVIGEPLTTLMPARLRADHDAGIGRYLRNGERTLGWEYVEFPGLRADGEEIPLGISFSEYEHDGRRYFTGIVRDISERKERERELVRQREQLAALNSLNEVVRGITDAIVEQSTREEIERIVCEQLAASDSYEFAWIADVNPQTRAIAPRVEVGTDGYLRKAGLSADPNARAGQGPAGRAVRTKEMQVSADVLEDPEFEPRRELAEEYGFRSFAAIPIAHGDTLYGLIGIYSARVDAFAEDEREVVGQLGEIVGHAIAAVDRERALMSDEVVELEFHVPALFEAVGTDRAPEGRIAIEETIPLTDDEYLVYGTADEAAVEGVSALVEAIDHWRDAIFREADDGTEFELRLVEPPVLSALASMGGSIERAVVDDGDFSMTICVPPSVDVRKVIDAVADTYPDAVMTARRQHTRQNDADRRVDRVLAERLTDRQRASLRAAYHAGFFDWPRKISGEEVAESLDVSPPTFHQHLRKAEQKVFDSLLSS